MLNFLFSLVLLLLSHANRSAAKAKTSSSLSFNVIHRDSILSPFHNKSTSDLLGSAADQGSTMVNSTINLRQKDYTSVVTPSKTGSYLVEIVIGNPKVELLATLDTKADLTWVRGKPYEKQLYTQEQEAKYDPKASATYKPQRYDTEFCKSFPISSSVDERDPEAEEGLCYYTYAYRGHGSITRGILSEETFHLKTSTDGEVARTFVFGCSHSGRGNFHKDAQGMVGLGRGVKSFISQLGSDIEHIFSYCFQPKEKETPSQLIFGSEARILGDKVASTRLEYDEVSGYNFITLTGVTIRRTERSIAAHPVRIMIDSTSKITLLHSRLYDFIESSIRRAVRNAPKDDPTSMYSLCYPSETTNIDQLPDIILQFAGDHDTDADAYVHLKPINTFQQHGDDLICMLIRRDDEKSILGHVAQVNFKIEFNLDANTVSFAPAVC